ncbi:unnamed protein product, partial [Staurois parvus]
MAEWEQWEAVQGPRSHCGTSSSVTRRYGGHGRFGAWRHLWKACNLPATYDKMENRRSVRRPQSGTWQSVEAMGGRTGTQVTLWDQ